MKATMMEPIVEEAPMPIRPKYPAPKDSAQDSENNVSQNAVTATLHYLTSQPTGDQPYYDPPDYSSTSHRCLLVPQAQLSKTCM